ncbi:MAG: 6-bladed beta-propeller [Gemmatimonadetes bacterium]|nr:6-bladed beta-propeller [Gemmatimonadota bacterium]
MRPCLLLLTTAFIPAACGADTSPAPAGPEVVVETIGDTTVVRTLSGSVWGAEATLVAEVSIGELDGPEELLFGSIWSIAVDDDHNVYVFDGQAQEVRVFDSAGVYVETLGRPGEGPGEFSRAEAIAMLADGRLVVRNPGNQRLEVFGPEAGETDQWAYNAGGLHTSSPLYTDVNGRTFVDAPDLSVGGFAVELIVFGPEGTQIDTLPVPSGTYEPPLLEARQGGISASHPVPLSPELLWTVHPSGHFLTGFSADYRIDLPRDDGVLRVERAADPVPAHEEERANERAGVVEYMRRMVPDWTWNGPPIPEHKPFFHELLAGRDGRIWVRLATEAQRVENEDHDPEDPSSMPVDWREPLRYDVFEPDGTYLGVVAPPEAFTHWVEPVFDGDHVWAVTRDELGIQRVVRYRIEAGGG